MLMRQTSVSVALHKRVATVRKHSEVPCKSKQTLQAACSLSLLTAWHSIQASKTGVQHKMAYFGTIQVGVAKLANLLAFGALLGLAQVGNPPQDS